MLDPDRERGLSSMIVTDKTCVRCKVKKPKSEFGISIREFGGLNIYCLECTRHQSRVIQRRIKKEKGFPLVKGTYTLDERRANKRNASLKRNYGITAEDFDKILLTQGGRCALCQEILPKEKACIDHCHNSEVIRGILCRTCNTRLGIFNDDPKFLFRAILYLGKKRS